MRVLRYFFSLPVFILLSLTPNQNTGVVMDSFSGLADDEIIQRAREAYLYGYPLVMMEITRRVMSNYEKPTSQGAPMNQLARREEFPDDKFTTVVKPNLDTYYALAWLDLSREPLVLEIPNTDGRFFLIPILDAWTNVIASPGKRTTGGEAQEYLLTGPGWTGNVPEQMSQIASSTSMAWLVGRTQVNGPEDGAAVVKLQQEYKLTPLSSYGKRYDPPLHKADTAISMKSPVRQVGEMPVEIFFNLMNQLMTSNPPFAADSAVISRIALIGVSPGATFDLAKFSPSVQDSLKDLPLWCKKYLNDLVLKRTRVNGWVVNRGLGVYGTDYNLRALVANKGLGANVDSDVVYCSSMFDADGERYDGSAHSYIMHFEKGEFPPTNAFWSLTMYGMDNFLVANKIGPFNLILRIYWPKEDVLNGTWIPPAVSKAE